MCFVTILNMINYTVPVTCDKYDISAKTNTPGQVTRVLFHILKLFWSGKTRQEQDSCDSHHENLDKLSGKDRPLKREML